MNGLRIIPKLFHSSEIQPTARKVLKYRFISGPYLDTFHAVSFSKDMP